MLGNNEPRKQDSKLQESEQGKKTTKQATCENVNLHAWKQ